MTAWTVALLSSREAPATLATSVAAALRAVAGSDVTVDVVVNGNPKLAEVVTPFLQALPEATAPGVTLRLWDLPLGDKAHAWNTYLHTIWPGSELAFFLDGYVAVRPDALTLIARALRNAPEALAGTGLPTVGRSARLLRERLLREGGLHGNLFALRGATMQRLRGSGFRMPLGLYRTDSLLNSVLCFNLDPATNGWDRHRVLLQPEASWSLPTLAWYRPGDLLTHLRRVLRQARGELEKRAFGDHLATRHLRPEALPATSVEMIANWLLASPDQADRLFLRSPLAWLTARRMLVAPRDWSSAAQPPRLAWAGTPGEVPAAFPPAMPLARGVRLLAALLRRPARDLG